MGKSKRNRYVRTWRQGEEVEGAVSQVEGGKEGRGKGSKL